MDRVLARLWMKDQAAVGTIKKQHGSLFTLTDAFQTPLAINDQDITTYATVKRTTEYPHTMQIQAGKDFWSMMDLAPELPESSLKEPLWTSGERILAIQYGNGAICMGMAFSDASLEELSENTIELYNAREFYHERQLSKAYKAYCASLTCMLMPGNAYIPIQSIKRMIDMPAFLRKEDGAIYNIPVAIGVVLQELLLTDIQSTDLSQSDNTAVEVQATQQSTTWEMAPPRDEKTSGAEQVAFERVLFKPPRQYEELEYQRFKDDLESKGFNLSKSESAEDEI